MSVRVRNLAPSTSIMAFVEAHFRPGERSLRLFLHDDSPRCGSPFCLIAGGCTTTNHYLNDTLKVRQLTLSIVKSFSFEAFMFFCTNKMYSELLIGCFHSDCEHQASETATHISFISRSIFLSVLTANKQVQEQEQADKLIIYVSEHRVLFDKGQAN